MSVRAVSPVRRCATPDDVAQLGQRMRGEMLSWARHRFPAPWDHEEVLQDALTAAVLDPGVPGDEDHVRACLYSHFGSRLRNRFRDEHVRVVADAPLDSEAVERVVDPDEAIDPPSQALHAWQRAVVEDLLAPYDETEQNVIRMRYRGGERARKMDGVVSRKQCAQMLGLELVQVRSIEDRVIRRLDEQIAAYDRSCRRREREIELAARRAAGHELSDDLLRRVEIGLRHLRVCGHCRHTFRAHRRRFATEIAVLVPVPAAIDHRPVEQAAGFFASLRGHGKAVREHALSLVRDPTTVMAFSNTRGGATSILAACGIAVGGAAGVCQISGVTSLAGVASAIGVSHTAEAPPPASAPAALPTTATAVAGTPGTPGTPKLLLAPAISPLVPPEVHGPAAARSGPDDCEACAEHGRRARGEHSPATAPAARPASSTTPEVAVPARTEPPASPTPPVRQSAPRSSSTDADACEACAERGG